MTSLDIDQIISSQRLPSLPTIALRVLELTSSEDIDLKEIARVIELDQGLVFKILRTVNSSYYGLARPCVTIRQALVYLGLNTVKTLVLGFSLVETMRPQAEDKNQASFDFVDYWRRDIYGAVAARELAQVTKICDPEIAFLAALMQDIGMVALSRVCGSEYQSCIQQTQGNHDKLEALERAQFGYGHTDVGAAIAEHWNLPEQLGVTMRWHHNAGKSPHQWRSFLRLIQSANLAATGLLSGNPHDAAAAFQSEVRSRLSLDAEQAKQVLRRVTEVAGEVASLFRIPSEESNSVDGIMAEAEERLIEHQLTMQRETTALREANESLSQQACTDALTGVANRAGFEQALRDGVNAANRQGATLSLIFIDMDRFKQINDTYGHQVGDVVLGDVAQRLSRSLPNGAHVSRYGGDEFVVLLFKSPTQESVAIAKNICDMISSTPIECETESGQPLFLSVTASMGVGTIDAKVCKGERGTLVRSADLGVYAAKSAGGGCVQVGPDTTQTQSVNTRSFVFGNKTS
jgi:diguanylate cyclase (GGDEF)-like protein